MHKQLADWQAGRTAAVRAAAEWRRFPSGVDSHAADAARMEALAAECTGHLHGAGVSFVRTKIGRAGSPLEPVR